MKGKVKIGLNMLLMIIVLGVIFYVMDNSLSDIFAQLMETSWLVLIAVIFFWSSLSICRRALNQGNSSLF